MHQPNLPTVRLEWPGKHDTPVPEARELQPVRTGSSAALLIEGDNAEAMRALGKRGENNVTLAYLDPPFFTGKAHVRINRERQSGGKIVRSTSPAFDDRWDSFTSYLQALRCRVVAARELLAPHGSLVLHVDPKTSHYAKVMCDEVFGEGCFASEIIWRYRRWPSKTKNFQRVHDVLLRFVRDPDSEPRFNQAYEPLAASTKATWGTRKQRAVVNKQGARTRSSSTSEESPGAPLGDVWEMSILAPVSKERTGYPTQKPEALIERLITTCTSPDDLILDPYVGSGTTMNVATRLKRRVIGIDASPEALSVVRQRLEKSGVDLSEERLPTKMSPMLKAGPRMAKARTPVVERQAAEAS